MTSLGGMMKTATEQWVEQLRSGSRLAELGKQGKITPPAFAFYMESVRYLLSNSLPNLAIAVERSVELGLPELAAYFEKKIEEERGHVVWAENDLASLPEKLVDGVRPAESIIELAELQRKLIAEHPAYFVAYIQWNEYFTVLIGDEWLDSLAGCGFERSKVSAISNHIEADRHHAAQGFKALDSLCQGPGLPDAPSILSVVQRTGKVFERFCDEVADAALR